MTSLFLISGRSRHSVGFLLAGSLGLAVAISPSVWAQDAGAKTEASQSKEEKAPEAEPQQEEAPASSSAESAKAKKPDTAKKADTAGTEKKAEPVAAKLVQSPEDTCSGGVVLDDGTVETGYGFFPTLVWGSFVQRFDTKQLSGKNIEQVCVCFLSTRGVKDMDFEVVFHEEVNGLPTDEPYASVTGHATEMPASVKEAGRFYPVSINDVKMPEGPSYVGVRWDPKKGNRVFLCASRGDQHKVEVQTQGYQRDSLSTAWDDVLKTKDRTFIYHQNALIRVVPKATKEGEVGASEESASASAAETPQPAPEG